MTAPAPGFDAAREALTITEFLEARIAEDEAGGMGMSSHKPIPELIEMFRRYQCKVCKVWVNYSEANGEWWHER